MKQLFFIGSLVFLSLGAMAQTKELEPAEQKEAVFVFVEQMPSFPGGEQALYKYIQENLRYPADAKKEGIEGRVYVKFIVSETGEIKNPESAKPVHKSLEQEAIRLVSSMPLWKPGKQNGHPVPVYFTLPISFRLE